MRYVQPPDGSARSQQMARGREPGWDSCSKGIIVGHQLLHMQQAMKGCADSYAHKQPAMISTPGGTGGMEGPSQGIKNPELINSSNIYWMWIGHKGAAQNSCHDALADDDHRRQELACG